MSARNDRKDHTPCADADGSAMPAAIVEQGIFYVGGRYMRVADEEILIGQMFVRYRIPAERKHDVPIVMIHSGGDTGASFLGTADGQPGWADYFLHQGYAVYIADQVGRGRSGYFNDAYADTRSNAGATRASGNLRSESDHLQATKYDRWPGGGRLADTIFDQFFASQIEETADFALSESLNRAAAAALLDRIGPAILLVQSQSSFVGWGAADDRPGKIAALVVIEPSGPPFEELEPIGAPEQSSDAPLDGAYSLVPMPLTHDAPLLLPVDLAAARETVAETAEHVRYWLQNAPARKLPKLAGLPILLVLGGASYLAPYDHCTSRSLTEAGVTHDFLCLSDIGITGNGHMMIVEKKNLEIAAFLDDWIERKARHA